MRVRFDAEAASLLSSRLRSAGVELSRQSQEREAAVLDVQIDFSGVAQVVFERACTIALNDRMALIDVFSMVADQVDAVAEQAVAEQERRDALDSWYERERIRLHNQTTGDPFQALKDEVARDLDPRPSTEPIRPRPLYVSFGVRARYHSTEGAPTSGRSSADPMRLRSFLGVARALDREAGDLVNRLSGDWTDFVDRCSWAPIERMDALGGLMGLLNENADDANWLERVAEAFERAGGGTLSDVAIGTCAIGRQPAPLRHLLDRSLTSPDVLAAWRDSGLRPSDVAGLPLATQIAFADLDGLPAAARDAASRAVLDAAERDPMGVYLALGLGSGEGIGLAEFTKQMSALRDAVRDADEKALDLPTGPEGKVAQLVGLSVDDGALVGAISLGNLDTADRVTVNVPGATTTVASMEQNVRVANDLFEGAAFIHPDTSFAVVSWIGYRTPAGAEALTDARAASGSPRLSGFIDGFLDARADLLPENISLLNHSYGSPTAVDACRDIRHRIDALVSYGSAGVDPDIDLKDLNVDKVFATEADADGTADIGRLWGLGPRVDPRTLDGAIIFSAEEGDGTKAVTGHDMSPDESNGDVGYLSPDATSFKSVVKIMATGDVAQ